MSEKKWAISSNEYIQRLRSEDPDRKPEVTLGDENRRGAQLTLCGITWDAISLTNISGTPVERARHRYRESLPDLIWNAAALEGNTFTLPEVRTLLDGVTVGGHRTADEQQILALSEAYSRLDKKVGSGEYHLSKVVSDELHKIVAVHEAIESGHFRGQGSVSGGGTVRLASGGIAPGIDAGANGEVLIEKYMNLLDYLGTLADPRERALAYFAAATRAQLYFDGNKRTARLMMTGELMSHGFDAVSIPYARKLEYNVALDRLFQDNDGTELMQFLASCAIG